MDKLQNNILLRATEESRLDQIFEAHCEDGRMTIPQFLLLALEKDMVSNQNGLFKYVEVFRQAAEGSKFLTNKKFYFAIILIADILFGDTDTPLENMFNKILADFATVKTSAETFSRIPLLDEENLAILSEDSITVLVEYEHALKNFFTMTFPENYFAGKKVLSWNIIERGNRKLDMRSLLRFAKQGFLLPHLLNVETFQDVIISIVPPRTPEEHEYFQQCVLIKDYEAEAENSRPLLHSQEPLVAFHEFLLILARIALQCLKMHGSSAEKLEVLLNERLGIPKKGEKAPKNSLYSSTMLKVGFLDLADEDDDDDSLENWDDSVEIEDPQAILAEYEKQNEEKLTTEVNFQEVFRILDDKLPKIPDLPGVSKINPPPYSQGVEYKGKPLPKPPVDKNAQKAKAKPPTKKSNKDEPPKIIKWGEKPGEFRETNLKHFRDYTSNMNTNTLQVLQNTKKTQPHAGIAPCVIRELLFPPTASEDITTLIESAFVYQNTSNYQLALKTMSDAKDAWGEIEELKSEVELFFLLAIGSIYESAGRDDLALGLYLQGRQLGEDKLMYNHPDRAIAYCGLGSVLCHSEEYGWALRCFLQARNIRELTLGGDTVDTATVYNNLGVCMYGMERNQESQAYFELAKAIFECELGYDHQRTLIAGGNLKKCRKQSLHMEPEFRPLWEIPITDAAPSKKGKKKKKGKKGKKKKK